MTGPLRPRRPLAAATAPRPLAAATAPRPLAAATAPRPLAAATAPRPLAALSTPARPLAAFALLSACWTQAAAPPPTAALAPDPTAPCPARLVGLVRNADTGAPLANATVVVETPAGSVAAELTDAGGRFEAPAVRPPARLRIYYGARAVEHKLAACQPPLRIGVHL